MKKSFLIVGALGVILSTNGFAVQSGGAVITYTCPAGCKLVVSTVGGQTNATCQRSAMIQQDDGSLGLHIYECDGPEINVQQNAVAPGTDFIEISEQTKTGTKKTRPTAARAAKTGPRAISQTTDTIEPVLPKIEEKAASGTVVVMCPEGCKPDCQTFDQGIICTCKTSSGELCAERATTTENTIRGFER